MPVKNYYSRNGQIEFEAVGSNVITYGRDMFGNVVAGYDNATNAVFTANYKPYGEFAQTTGNITGQRFLYCGTHGYRFSPSVPVSHYVRTRHLMMRMGMWTSVDPLWPLQRSFDYVHGNPQSEYDYLGLIPETPCSGLNLQGALSGVSPRGIPGTKPTSAGSFTGRGISDVLRDVLNGKIKPPKSRAGWKKPECKLVTCAAKDGIFAGHVSYFVDLGFGAGCAIDRYPDRKLEDRFLSDFISVREDVAADRGRCLECTETPLPCEFAEKMCQCVAELHADISSFKDHFRLWLITGTCYKHHNHAMLCAAVKEIREDLTIGLGRNLTR